MVRRLLLGVAALLVWAAPAAAHPTPLSYLNIVFHSGQIDGTLVVHIFDVSHDAGIDPAEQLLDRNFLGPRRQQIANLLAPRILLRSDHRLRLEWTDVIAMPEEQTLHLTFRVSREDPGALTIDTALFPYDPNHQTFVNVYEGDDLRQQMIFAADTPEHTYYRGTTQGVIAVMKTFIPAGIHHILIGPDHILFLIGLLLLGGSWGALARIVTAFTLGHSLTLSLAALNYVSPPAALIEPAIALSIVFVGADNLVRGGGRDLRALAAAVFGLVHGFGFANVLREFGLPREALGWSLFSFNVGVEIGPLAIVVVVAAVLGAIRRRSTLAAYRVAYAGSVIVIAAGTYWFVQRVFFPGGV
jgi:hypothetical protein